MLATKAANASRGRMSAHSTSKSDAAACNADFETTLTKQTACASRGRVGCNRLQPKTAGSSLASGSRLARDEGAGTEAALAATELPNTSQVPVLPLVSRLRLAPARRWPVHAFCQTLTCNWIKCCWTLTGTMSRCVWCHTAAGSSPAADSSEAENSFGRGENKQTFYP